MTVRQTCKRDTAPMVHHQLLHLPAQIVKADQNTGQLLLPQKMAWQRGHMSRTKHLFHSIWDTLQFEESPLISLLNKDLVLPHL